MYIVFSGLSGPDSTLLFFLNTIRIVFIFTIGFRGRDVTLFSRGEQER